MTPRPFDLMALSLPQPQATLACHGIKQLDGRGYATKYRGPVAIYAAHYRMGLDRASFRELCLSEPFRRPLYELLSVATCYRLPRRLIIGTAELVEVEEIESDEARPPYPESEFGQYAPGRCIWMLEDAKPLARPVVVPAGIARGNLWRPPRAIREEIFRRASEASAPVTRTGPPMQKLDSPPAQKPTRDEYIVLSKLMWKGREREPGERIEFCTKGSHANRDRWLNQERIRPLTDDERAGSKPVLPRGKVAQAAKPPELAQMLPLALIRPDPTQPRRRFESEALRELAESIRIHGVTNPILVRPLPMELPGATDLLGAAEPPRYEIVAGERRWRASKEAGRTEILAMVRHLSDVEAAEKQAIENLQREDLTPLEEAAGYRKLLALPDYSMEKLAESTGRKKNTIYGKLKLLELPPEAQESLERGDLPEATAEYLGRLKGEVQARAVQAVLHPEQRWDRQDAKVLTIREAKEKVERIGHELEREKKLAEAQASATARELKWLDEKAKQAIVRYSDTPEQGSGYITLEQTCPGDPKFRSYGKLLELRGVKTAAKDVKPVAAMPGGQHWQPEAVELFDEKQVREILTTAGVVTSNRRQAANTEQAKTKAKDKQMKAVLDKSAAIIRLKAQAFCPRIAQTPEATEMWWALARCAVSLASNDDMRHFCRRRGLEAVARKSEHYIKPQVNFQATALEMMKGKGASELAGIVSELLLTASAWSSYSTNFRDAFLTGAPAFGVDVARLKREALGAADEPAEEAEEEGEEESADVRTKEMETAA